MSSDTAAVRETDRPVATGRHAARRYAPALAMVAVAAGLLAFHVASQRVEIPFGIFPHPPMYGYWEPVWHPLALWVLPAALLLGAMAWLLTTGRGPAWAALGFTIGCGLVAAVAVALVRGDWHDLVEGASTDPRQLFYPMDLHFVYEHGVRGFVERHADLIPEFGKHNSKTHPAGVLVFLYVLFETIGASHPLRITTAIAAIGLSAAVAAWLMGRTIGGERAGRIAAVLFVAAPGPLLLAYTGMDAIFGVLLATAAALFMVAATRASPPVAAAAGAVLGLAALMTYAVVFVAVAAATAVVVQAPSVRRAVSLLGAAAAGGLAVLVTARLALGFDVFASYQALPRSGVGYSPYWLLGHPVALLTWAGLPLATFGVAGLFARTADRRRLVLPIALITLLLVWGALPSEVTGLRYGEVERTWAFLYPVLAAVAAPVVDRWTSGFPRWRGAVVAGLVVVSVAQAALLQALWINLV